MNEILRRLEEAEKLIDIYEKYNSIDITKDNSGKEYFYTNNFSLFTNYHLYCEDVSKKGTNISINLYFDDKELNIRVFNHYYYLPFAGTVATSDKDWNTVKINGDFGKIISRLKDLNVNSELIDKIQKDLESRQSIFSKLKDRIRKYKK